MALPLGSSIETQITDGPTLVSQMNNNVQAIQSVVQDVPQIQTVLTDNVVNVSSIINAPFIEVTSVNGMTGDVVVEPIIEDFQANHYYLKNTMINYNGQIYWAKNTFTSGSSFNASDWNAVSISISTAWNDITGKPTFATVATSGSYNDLSNKPTIPTVNNATLTIQKNGTTVKTFTANASSNVTANITVPTAVTDLSDASNYVTQTDIADVIRTTDVGVIRGQNIADSEITSSKIDWSTMTAYGSNSSTVALTTSNQTVLTVSLANFNNTDVLEFVVTVLAFGNANGNGLVVNVGGIECVQVGTWGRTCTFVGYNTKANLGSNLVISARKDASYTLDKTFASAVVRRIG